MTASRTMSSQTSTARLLALVAVTEAPAAPARPSRDAAETVTRASPAAARLPVRIPSTVARDNGSHARGGGHLRPPHPGQPVPQGQAGGRPADRGGPAEPVPRLGRRGRVP